MEYKVKINSMFYEFIFSNVTFGKIFSIQSQSNNEDFISIKAKAKQLITLQMPQLTTPKRASDSQRHKSKS